MVSGHCPSKMRVHLLEFMMGNNDVFNKHSIARIVRMAGASARQVQSNRSAHTTQACRLSSFDTCSSTHHTPMLPLKMASDRIASQGT